MHKQGTIVAFNLLRIWGRISLPQGVLLERLGTRRKIRCVVLGVCVVPSPDLGMT